jgi:hypothetical protein
MLLVGVFITLLRGFGFGVWTWDISRFLQKNLIRFPFTPFIWSPPSVLHDHYHANTWSWDSKWKNKLKQSSLTTLSRLNTRNLFKRKNYKNKENNYNCVFSAIKIDRKQPFIYSSHISQECWRHLCMNWNMQHGHKLLHNMKIVKTETHDPFFVEIFIIAVCPIWKNTRLQKCNVVARHFLVIVTGIGWLVATVVTHYGCPWHQRLQAQ